MNDTTYQEKNGTNMASICDRSHVCSGDSGSGDAAQYFNTYNDNI